MPFLLRWASSSSLWQRKQVWIGTLGGLSDLKGFSQEADLWLRAVELSVGMQRPSCGVFLLIALVCEQSLPAAVPFAS